MQTPLIPLHDFWTHFWQFVHKVELLPTHFLQTPQAIYFQLYTVVLILIRMNITLIFPVDCYGNNFGHLALFCVPVIQSNHTVSPHLCHYDHVIHIWSLGNVSVCAKICTVLCVSQYFLSVEVSK